MGGRFSGAGWGAKTLAHGEDPPVLTRFGAPVDESSVEDLTSDDLVFMMGVVPLRIDILTDISGVSANVIGRDANLIDVRRLSRKRDP